MRGLGEGGLKSHPKGVGDLKRGGGRGGGGRISWGLRRKGESDFCDYLSRAEISGQEKKKGGGKRSLRGFWKKFDLCLDRTGQVKRDLATVRQPMDAYVGGSNCGDRRSRKGKQTTERSGTSIVPEKAQRDF